MRKWLFLFCLLSIVACKSKNAADKLIPQKELVDLLVDLHIADAIALNHAINENFGKLDSAILYHTVLEKHGYTKDQMEASIKYYSRDVEKMIGIYDDVFGELSKMSEDAKEVYSSASTSRTYRVWKAQKNRYTIKGDTVKYLPPFDFAVDTTGNFVLSVNIKLLPKDESVNPRISAYFYDPEDDRPEKREYFEDIVLTKGNFTREYAVFKVMRKPELSRMRIILPVQDNPDSTFSKGIEIHNLRLGLMRSDRRK